MLAKIYSRWAILLYDICCIPLAWYVSFYVRYTSENQASPVFSHYALILFAILFPVQIFCYYRFKIYRGLWRFSSIDDVIRIIRSILSASIFTIIIIYIFSLSGHGISRAILSIYSMILISLLCGGRLLFRYRMDCCNKDLESDKKRVLIIGAGQAGAGLVRELKRSNQYIAVGFIDDDISKSGNELHGIRVLGCISDLPKLSVKYKIDLIFIAIPSATALEMRKILSYCEGCETRTLPGLSDILSGRVGLDVLRQVSIDDLLGREQVKIDKDHVGLLIKSANVLVTGGGGSIGSELCRQICMFHPEKLIIVDHNEYNLYSIDKYLTKSYPDISLELVLLNITDYQSMRLVFDKYRPSIVFHAAAYKHVPLLESQIKTAIYNNVIGTKIVAQVSVEFEVNKFILISTDKAVNPTNVMGATKRVAELICQNWNDHSNTQFITVRFGNVLGSIGSVVPLFQQQLQHGGPLTVTHPDMERYFMTIPEASLLILQSMSNGLGGEIFVLDMGEPVKISYLAEQMIRLSGKKPGQDIMIEYTGLRPGEKLFEELFHVSEQLLQTEHPKLFKAKKRLFNWYELMQTIQMMHESLHDEKELIVLLKSLVPEFAYDISVMEVNN